VIKENKTNINCSLFQKQESEIKIITDKINKAMDIQGKASYAEELLERVEVLLSCPDFDGKRLDCKNCHVISHWRKKTTNIIKKIKKLA
jgi:hypothetical protein